MGKYEPLASRLSDEIKDSWTATFAEVEGVLGFPLPPSARKFREWWANQHRGGHSQARGWQEAGWHVERVDMAKERVEFQRNRPVAIRLESVSSSEMSDDELVARAAAYLGVNDKAQIIREALKALCQREASLRLARLGGSFPDVEAPPRRRFG